MDNFKQRLSYFLEGIEPKTVEANTVAFTVGYLTCSASVLRTLNRRDIPFEEKEIIIRKFISEVAKDA